MPDAPRPARHPRTKSHMVSGRLRTVLVKLHLYIGLVFGLLQFVTTFVIAWLYSSYSTKRLDPLARVLNEEFEQAKRDAGTAGGSTGKEL